MPYNIKKDYLQIWITRIILFRVCVKTGENKPCLVQLRRHEYEDYCCWY